MSLATKLIVLSALLASAPAAALPTGFKARAEALLATAATADGPGVSVAIIENGRIVFRGQRGQADIAARRRIDAHTVFRLASITKQFAAAVVLQLAAEGRLGLDDPIERHLPGFPNGSAITVRELLNHTSGIQDYTDLPSWMVEVNTSRPHTTGEMVALFRDLPPKSVPGTAWAYNNSGYILVAALIESVTGHPWYEEVDRRIARPLHLGTLRYGRAESSIAAMARGYSRDASGAASTPQRIDLSVASAAGALVADATDVARWGYALHHGAVVPTSYYAQMIAPTRLSDGSSVPYGLGLSSGHVRSTPVIGHDGNVFGFSGDTAYLPDQGIFIVVLANSDKPAVSTGLLIRRLVAMAAGNPFPAFAPRPLDPGAIAPFLGSYRLGTKDRVLKVQDGRLVYVRTDSTSDLVPIGDGRYSFGADTLSWLETKLDANGEPTIVVYSDGEDHDGPGRRVGPVPANG